MNLDLPRAQLSELSIYLDIDESSFGEVLGVLGASSFEELEDVYYLFHYSRADIEHEVSGHFIQRGANRFALHVTYDTVPVEWESARDWNELVSVLASMQLPVQIRTDATFRFALDSWQPVFRLPWIPFERSATLPFDEITGVRVLKRGEDGSIQWTAILDLWQDSLMISSSYSFESVFAPVVFSQVYTRALAVVANLVIQRESAK